MKDENIHFGGPGGLDTLYRVTGGETGGRFAVVEHTLAPGMLGAPPHTHQNEDEFSYILEGELTVLLGDAISKAPAGTWVRKPRGQSHTFWNGSDAPVRLLEIISPAGFENYFAEIEAFTMEDPVNTGAIGATAAKYGLTMQFEKMGQLMEENKLKLF